MQLVVGMDQIGNYILPNNSSTFHDRGAEQVDIAAKDEKRAYTLTVASTPDGDFLPWQQIWSGATKTSVPKPNALRMEEAIEYGFDFAFAKSETNKGSHYSTLKTMKEVRPLEKLIINSLLTQICQWIENVLVPWRRHVIESDPDLDDDQKAILYIDCYPVHTGEGFRTYVWDKHPYIILIFVPANCECVEVT